MAPTVNGGPDRRCLRGESQIELVHLGLPLEGVVDVLGSRRQAAPAVEKPDAAGQQRDTQAGVLQRVTELLFDEERQGGRAGRLRPPKLLRAGPARR